MVVVLHLVKVGGMNKAERKTKQWSPSHLNYQPGLYSLCFDFLVGLRTIFVQEIHLKQNDKEKSNLDPYYTVLFMVILMIVKGKTTFKYPTVFTKQRNLSSFTVSHITFSNAGEAAKPILERKVK